MHVHVWMQVCMCMYIVCMYVCVCVPWPHPNPISEKSGLKHETETLDLSCSPADSMPHASQVWKYCLTRCWAQTANPPTKVLTKNSPLVLCKYTTLAGRNNPTLGVFFWQENIDILLLDTVYVSSSLKGFLKLVRAH